MQRDIVDLTLTRRANITRDLGYIQTRCGLMLLRKHFKSLSVHVPDPQSGHANMHLFQNRLARIAPQSFPCAGIARKRCSRFGEGLRIVEWQQQRILGVADYFAGQADRGRQAASIKKPAENSNV